MYRNWIRTVHSNFFSHLPISWNQFEQAIGVSQVERMKTSEIETDRSAIRNRSHLFSQIDPNTRKQNRLIHILKQSNSLPKQYPLSQFNWEFYAQPEKKNWMYSPHTSLPLTNSLLFSWREVERMQPSWNREKFGDACIYKRNRTKHCIHVTLDDI